MLRSWSLCTKVEAESPKYQLDAHVSPSHLHLLRVHRGDINHIKTRYSRCGTDAQPFLVTIYNMKRLVIALEPVTLH